MENEVAKKRIYTEKKEKEKEKQTVQTRRESRNN